MLAIQAFDQDLVQVFIRPLLKNQYVSRRPSMKVGHYD